MSKQTRLAEKRKQMAIAISVCLIGALLAATMPAILTRIHKYKAHETWYYFNGDTGVIGDTIGGIAGPILNFAGLILVYLSFQQQLDANNEQRRALRKEISHRNKEGVFNTIRLAIDTFSTDVKLHEKSFRRLVDAKDNIQAVAGRLIKAPEGKPSDDLYRLIDKHWDQLRHYDALATFLNTRYDDANMTIQKSKLNPAQKRLLEDSLRQRCLLLISEWVSKEDLDRFENWDEEKFNATPILTTLTLFQSVDFPAIVNPELPFGFNFDTDPEIED